METFIEAMKLIPETLVLLTGTFVGIPALFLATVGVGMELKERIIDKYVKNKNWNSLISFITTLSITTTTFIGLGSFLDAHFGTYLDNSNQKLVNNNTIHKTGIKTAAAEVQKISGVSNKDKIVMVLKNQNMEELDKILKNTNFNKDEIIQLKKQYYLIKYLEKEAKNNPQLKQKIDNLKNAFIKYVNEHKINNTSKQGINNTTRMNM